MASGKQPPRPQPLSIQLAENPTQGIKPLSRRVPNTVKRSGATDRARLAASGAAKPAAMGVVILTQKDRSAADQQSPDLVEVSIDLLLESRIEIDLGGQLPRVRTRPEFAHSALATAYS